MVFCSDRLRPLSYPQTDVFAVTFSIVNPASFDNIISKWNPEISHHCPTAAKVLIGTKSDLRDDPIVRKKLLFKGNELPISTEQGIAMAKHIGCTSYMETSSMNGSGINDLPEALVKCVILGFGGQYKPLHEKKKCLLQ